MLSSKIYFVYAVRQLALPTASHFSNLTRSNLFKRKKQHLKQINKQIEKRKIFYFLTEYPFSFFSFSVFSFFLFFLFRFFLFPFFPFSFYRSLQYVISIQLNTLKPENGNNCQKLPDTSDADVRKVGQFLSCRTAQQGSYRNRVTKVGRLG